MRVCLDNNPKTVEVKFNGGILEDDTILLCAGCISRHPFNKQILSKKELIQIIKIESAQKAGPRNHAKGINGFLQCLSPPT